MVMLVFRRVHVFKRSEAMPLSHNPREDRRTLAALLEADQPRRSPPPTQLGGSQPAGQERFRLLCLSFQGLTAPTMTGWWFEPSEKYEFVNGKDDIPYIYIMEIKINVPNHQMKFHEIPQY
jgi:hypothetical protein